MPDTETLELARICHEIVFRVAAVCFDGALPNDPCAVVGSILSILPAETPAEKLEQITPHLLAAVREYQRMQRCQLPL